MPRVFPPEWLDELKTRCDIVDIISCYVLLKKNNREFVGACPFHHEKTPSFFVYPESQSYHCFGCKESGDVIKFVSKYENIGFVETVERLANMTNMVLPDLPDVDLKKIEEKKKERQQLLQCLRDCAIYYFNNLNKNTNQSKLAMQYLQKRQINNASIRKFGIGCSLDFESSLNYLLGKGYSMDLLKKAGLATEVNGRIYDSFGKRLTFPLFNKEGEVIGFSARLLEDKELAKYKNTSATPIFNKSEVIFAINVLKKMRDEKRAENSAFELPYIIIVEGQIDTITMHQFGFHNTIACLGTALTPMHARKIKTFCENIVLLMDGDEAGRKSALRSIDVLRGCGLNVSVATLPDKYDPDEFLKSKGALEMQNLLDNAIEGMLYKLKVLAGQYDLRNITERSKFVHQALIILKNLDNQSEQDMYLNIVRDYAGTPVEVLRMDLSNIVQGKEKVFYEKDDNEAQNIRPIKKDGYTIADQFILASLLYNKDYAQNIDISSLSFVDDGLKQCFEYIKQAKQNGQPSISGLYSCIDVENATQFLQEVVNFEFIPDPFPELTLQSYVYKNIERSLNEELESSKYQLQKLQDKEARDNEMKHNWEIVKRINANKDKLAEISSQYMLSISEINKGKRGEK